MMMMENIIDAHYFVLPSQGNVYSLTKLCMSNGANKILAASLRRKVFSFEYSGDSEGFLKATVKEVLFTYIPNGTEIISIDAFTRSQSSDDFVIGITIIKSSEHSTETYLNIYSEWEPSSEINLDSVSQNCLMIELNFIPYQLYHTQLCTNAEDESNKEVVWLLSGSDEKIHMFREDRANHTYSEVDVAEHFPELVDPPSIILWMDIYNFETQTRRVSAFGCECGFVKLAIVDVTKKEVLSSWSARFGGPVSTVRLFTEESQLKAPSFLNLHQKIRQEELPVHLLVSNTLQPSVVYMNVMEQGLRNCFPLPDSEHYDAALCSTIADVDMDGRNEIVLGTYGQEVLVYKYQQNESDKAGSWFLRSQRSFANPIHSILYLDVTGDGVKEFVILTLRGVHIMQHDPKDVSEVFDCRFKLLTDLQTSQET
ncbi:KICSTOR complex protein kaptin-like isoform X2 [Periplaneta americana]